jgi:SM-20-related protein
MIDVAAVLAQGGLVVRDGFLSAAELQTLRSSAEARRERGEFQAARIGARRSAERHPEVRGDVICWLEAPFEPGEQALLERLEELRLEINRQAFLGLFELELHYACYPPGTHYERHLDQPRDGDERRISLVLYLNTEWCAADGGMLRIQAADTVHEIEPLGGRLVLFSSPDCEHEVLRAHRERHSVTGWFRTRSAH